MRTAKNELTKKNDDAEGSGDYSASREAEAAPPDTQIGVWEGRPTPPLITFRTPLPPLSTELFIPLVFAVVVVADLEEGGFEAWNSVPDFEFAGFRGCPYRLCREAARA